MLIEFRVENHRSLRDEQILTMEAARRGDDTDRRPRRSPRSPETLLPAAALYGGNASGKSNVLDALGFMRDAVIWSHRAWAPAEGVPRDPFAWGPKRVEPSTFEVTFRQAATRFQYGFVASDECFLEEWLYAWPLGKKQVWYERDRQEFKIGDNFKGENRAIEAATRTNSLFLSAAVQNNHPYATDVYSWFRHLRSVRVGEGRHLPRVPRTIGGNLAPFRMIQDRPLDALPQMLFGDDSSNDSLMVRFRDLLKTADIGILDLRVGQGEADKLFGSLKHRLIELKHHAEFDDSWLPLGEESRGTQTLFRLATPILQTLDVGAVLLVDELEASLHPALGEKIVRIFSEPASNPKDAQLIFTTHDTNLLGTTLGEPALRRDQVWLTEKDKEGATVLYPLTDYKPRKAENIERGYLQGRYGAIPFLGGLTVTGGLSEPVEG